MTAEFDDPKDLNEMRQVAHEWIKNRPTIKHTPQSLASILTSEVNELNEAVQEKQPQQIIDLEMGDVLFSLLALEGESNREEYARSYSIIDKYCKVRGITLIGLFKATHYKNRVNYPVTFFNEMSPFPNPKDAISCLRIFRNVFGDPKSLDEHWAVSDREIDDVPFFDGWHAVGQLRSFVKRTLNNISRRKGTTQETRTEIKRLKEAGEWDVVPLDIPENVFAWRR